MASFQGFGQGKNRFSAKDIERIFWTKVDKDSEDKCWIFKEGKTKDGYGIFRGNGAHRFAYESHYKCKIPYKKFVLHKCDNPACCNPLHLYIGTQLDNMHDKMKRGRHVIGTNPTKTALSNAGFSAETILAIRKLKGRGITQEKIAERFKVCQGTVSNIWRRSKFPCKEGYYV